MADRERLVFISPGEPPKAWESAFRTVAPEIEFLSGKAEIAAPETIEWAVVWKPPQGALAKLTGLKCVFSLGAGVDHVLADSEYPRHVPLSRVVDPYLTSGMTEYVVLHVLAHHRDLFRNLKEQAEARWKPFAAKRADEVRVGILGLGELGLDAARKLVPFGYRLAGWSNTRKSEPGIESFAGLDELPAFLGRTDILVCLLPLTEATSGILNTATFDLLPQGARVINAARGGHLIESDLIDALDTGHLAGATLDVFQQEPLPADSPLWAHPKVVVTPHMAAMTDARSTAMAMAESMARVRRDEPPLNPVDLARGY
ncbi:Glyoxylate/hydroxypyruvate reductase A [Alphaproteobacteria bacterium SO-S41]|nr:Glyoxylate/hydroxypyruvate reductase A [Alphaproteobacteria bacterium SO-S41]